MPFQLICLVFALVLAAIAGTAWFVPEPWPWRIRLVALSLMFYYIYIMLGAPLR